MSRNISLFALFVFFLFSCDSNSERLKICIPQENDNAFCMSDIQNSKASVFVFFDINCPVCQSFTSEIVGLQEKTKSNNIQWYCIIPSTTCDLDSIRKFTESFRFPIRMIRDEKGILSHNLKAEITPEAFLINSSGRIMYRGAINNLFEDLGTRRQVVTKNYLSDAIQQYLNGMDILVKETKAVGCFIE